ncbi:MAG TPA: carbonic anhydrase family protein [Longimicrobium sp.]|nr:carbonic anhydrase family protein [Longimicrobium sp.]
MRFHRLLPLAVLCAAPAAAQQTTVCPTPPTPGREQSPVDIRQATPTRMARLGTHYPVVSGRAYNTGHTVQVSVASGDRIVIDSDTFQLVQFHFHWPSEHQFLGDSFPAEIHMVHQGAGGKLAVLGTWVRRGAYNRAWNQLFSHLPREGDTLAVRVDVHRMFGFADLNAERVYRYCGSLTTGSAEPYQEGVTWLMRRTTITLSPAQLDSLHHAMHRYSRDVQPLNGRVIRYRPVH